MSLSIEAAHLNNEGVAYLQSGNYPRSIELFGQSIKFMKQELSKPTATNGEETQSSSSDDFLAVELPLQEQTDQQETFIFNQAFQVPENKADVILKNDSNTMSAVIIFNLALARHSQYISSQQNKYGQTQDQQCLVGVEKLYITALKLLNDQSCRNNCTALIVKLACVNNLSIIGSNSCYRAAAEALKTLSSFVSSGRDLDNKKNGEIFEETKLQRLLMNVLLLKAPKVAPAA